MFNHIKISAAAALLVAVPAIASAQTVGFGNAPVAVNSYQTTQSIDPSSYVGPISTLSERLRTENDVTVNYVNNANVAASSVTFVLDSGKTTQTVVAKGNFAPGAAISRTFVEDADVNPDAQTKITVAEVRFTDGNVWQAPRTVSVR